MSKELVERLKTLIAQSGKSMRAISKDAGMSDGAVRGVLRDPPGSPTVDTVQKLAVALGVRPGWLAGFEDDGPTIASGIEPVDTKITTLNIVGEVAAGVWMDADSDAFEPIPYDVPADPRYPENRQYLLRVKGTSINRKAPSGALVRCLDVYAVANRKPRNNDWVIIQRKKPDDSVETIVKKLIIDRDGEFQFWPDSDDPKFQEPIKYDRNDGSSLLVVAYVLDFINPATRL